ncbi:hypothetical protein [Embleya scabrispora]|nr:hypothetical protein [Embleya scabrispora]MYS87431.1 hypothetical protein [Streptomyces sp. SID5474]
MQIEHNGNALFSGLLRRSRDDPIAMGDTPTLLTGSYLPQIAIGFDR